MLHTIRLVLLLAVAGLLNPALAAQGSIDPATVVVNERVRFEAAVPGTFAATPDQVFSVGANGVYFTGSPVRGPGTNLPLEQVVPLPASAIRKFNPDGSVAWLRLRQTHIVTEQNSGVQSAFERHSPEEPFTPVPVEDAELADQVTHLLATPDGGVMVVADLYQRGVENYEGPNGSTGRREYPERTTRTLYRKFDAQGNLLWKQMTVTDADLSNGPTTRRILTLPDGSLATLLTTVSFNASSAQNQTFNRQSIVRILDGTTGNVRRQKIFGEKLFGGPGLMEYRDCLSRTMEMDAQGRLYVLSREQTSVAGPDDAKTRNIVRRIDPATLQESLVESRERGASTFEEWTVLAVDGPGSIHVGGIYTAVGADFDLHGPSQRAVILKYTAALGFQWRAEGPIPERLQALYGTVEPTGLHVSAQGVTLVEKTHVVSNDNFFKRTRSDTIRISPEGALLWHRELDAEVGDSFSGKGFYADFSEVDAAGNVYLAGSQSVGPPVHANFVKYSSAGVLQFIRLIDANHRHSDFTLAPNGNPTSLTALNEPAGTSVILELQNPAVVDTPLPPAPTITSALAASGQPGRAFTYAIRATETPTSFAATDLPAGLTVSTTTGVISGTPTVEGGFSVVISATNAGGTGSATLVLAIDADGPPELSGAFTKFKVRRTATRGLQIRGLAAITNSGPQAALNFVQSIYLSSDAVLDLGTDVSLGKVDGVPGPFRGKLMEQLAGNGTIGPKPVKIVLSRKAAKQFIGKYLIIVIDSGDAVAEPDETNNTIVIGPLTP